VSALASIGDALCEAYPDAVLLVDANGRIVHANQAAAQLFDYDHGELLQIGVETLVPEAACARHAGLRRDYQAHPARRPMGLQMDLSARRRDGSAVLVEIALSPVSLDGASYVLASIRSIGDYPRVRQALQRARHAEAIAQMARMAVDSGDGAALLQAAPRIAAQALEATSAALFLLDPAGRSVECVAACGAPLAVPRAEDVAAPATVAPSATDALWRVGIVERGRTIGSLHVQAAAHTAWGDDSQRFLESFASLLATVLQRQSIERALRHAQQLEAVGQLTGGIAHDFNNLLTVIHGNLQVLEDLPSLAGDKTAQELVAAASRASRRGGELTGKLLAFSRRQLLQPRAIDLPVMLRSLASLLQRTLDARIRIELSLPDGGDASCLADPAQLESALLNLAINARDAMPDGGTLRFAVESCALPPPGADEAAWAAGGVAIAVADTGSGMSEDVRARAFEPFFTTKESGRGTGLGLATVHGFVHQSHGVVTLDSRIGKGTTVTLYLPRPGDASPRRAKARGATPAVPTGLTVLLVEDEPDVLRVVRAFLEQWGCTVVACSHAEAALQAAAAPGAHFDLLLTDVVLGPGLRGEELAQRLRAARPALPVLLMSGYAQDLQTAAVANAPLLRKPFTREQLAQAMLSATAPR
jgi:PAS domain S-box-containing protein